MTLLTTHGPSDDPDGLGAHLPRCEQVVSLPDLVPKVGSARFLASLVRSWASSYPVDLWKWRVPQMRDALERMIAREPFDLLVADFLFAEPNLPARRTMPVVFFSHNVEYLIWKRLAGVEKSIPRRLLLEVEWRKVRGAEMRAVRRATRTVAVSPGDRDVFAADAPGAAIDVVPTGVDIDYYSPGGRPQVRRRLVFSGSMDWYPNEDAILYFAEQIWPLLRYAAPDISLTVVGRHPTARLIEASAAAGITITGTVDDVRPHIDEAELYVVPLRVGGGTRLKIFEALAMGKAVVSTTIGAEGLGLEPGRHFAVADTPEAFGSAVLTLLDNPDRRNQLGTAGRELVRARYAWPQVAREFEGFLRGAVEGRDASEPYSARRIAVSSR